MNIDSSSAKNDYRHIMSSPEYACVNVIKSGKTAHKPLRKKAAEKKNTRNMERKRVRKAKKKTVPVQWNPIVF